MSLSQCDFLLFPYDKDRLHLFLENMISFDPTNIYINMSSGTVTNHALYFSDGTPDGQSSVTDQVVHSFRTVGETAVVIESTDDENNVLMAGTKGKVRTLNIEKNLTR